MSQSRSVRKKQIVLYQGEATIQVYLVRKGVVRAYTALENGAEVIIALFGPGDYFPVSFQASKAPVSMFYYEMMSDGEIESFSIPEFRDYRACLEDEDQDTSRRYLGALLHINALVQINSYQKLAHILRYLALRFGTDLNNKLYRRIELKLTQQDLAGLCNMSRETTNIELNKLKSKAIVSERAKIYSVNVRAINKIIGDDIDETLEI